MPIQAADSFGDFVEITKLRDQKKSEQLIWACQTYLVNHSKSVANGSVRYYLAEALFGTKKYQETIETASQLLEQSPDSDLKEVVVMLRGESYRTLKKYEESIPDFRAAYELSAAGNGAIAAHAQYHIIQAHHFLKRPKEAEAEFRLMEKKYPTASYVRSAATLLKVKATLTAAPVATGPKNGERAPEIEFIQLKDGKKRKLSEFKGKVVVVDFWASWCGPCQAPMARMQTYRDNHQDWGEKVELIALSIDNTREAATDHLKKKGWNKTFNAWAGDGGFRAPAPTAYGVCGIPKVFVIDQAGNIASSGHPMSLDVTGIITKLLTK